MTVSASLNETATFHAHRGLVALALATGETTLYNTPSQVFIDDLRIEGGMLKASVSIGMGETVEVEAEATQHEKDCAAEFDRYRLFIEGLGAKVNEVSA